MWWRLSPRCQKRRTIPSTVSRTRLTTGPWFHPGPDNGAPLPWPLHEKCICIFHVQLNFSCMRLYKSSLCKWQLRFIKPFHSCNDIHLFLSSHRSLSWQISIGFGVYRCLLYLVRSIFDHRLTSPKQYPNGMLIQFLYWNLHKKRGLIPYIRYVGFLSFLTKYPRWRMTCLRAYIY